MSFFKKSIYALSLVGMAGLWSCSQDEMLPGGVAEPGQTVRLTLSVNRGDAQTRTTIEEDETNGTLKSAWAEGDFLYVYNSNGKKIGTLDIESGVGDPTGVFSGEIAGVKDGQYISLWYYNLIDGKVSEVSESAREYLKIDLSEQSFGEASEFAPYDILTSADVSDENPNKEGIVQIAFDGEGKATVKKDVTLKSRLAFARFTLTGLPEGAAGSLYINNADGQIYTVHGLSFFNTSRVADIKSDTGIKVSNVTKDNDVFVALVPCYNSDVKEYRLGFKFVNAADDAVYAYEFASPTTIVGGKYYCADDGGGFEIPMTEIVPEYDIIFKKYPEGADEYDFEEDKTNPASVELPGNPDPDNHHEFLGWKKEGTDDQPTKDPWDLTAEGKGPVVTLVPVYSEYYLWTIEWRSGYGDNALVENQGQTIYRSTSLSNNNQRVQTPYGLNGRNDAKYNPVREGCSFVGWQSTIDPTKKGSYNSPYSPYEMYDSNSWTHVMVAMWKRQYEIVYHFDSADPDHKNSNTEGNTSYNALLIDRPTNVADGYNYIVIDPSSERFDNQGKVAMTNADGGKFLGWKKCVACADDYDASAANRTLAGGDTWTFEDGKYRLHLEPVYETVAKKTYTIRYQDEDGNQIKEETVQDTADEYVFTIADYSPEYMEYQIGWSTTNGASTVMTTAKATKQNPVVTLYPVYDKKTVKTPGYKQGEFK